MEKVIRLQSLKDRLYGTRGTDAQGINRKVGDRMNIITLFACALGGCIVGFIVASFSDSKIITQQREEIARLKKSNEFLSNKPEVTEIRTYTEDPHGFDALYKPF